MKNKSIASLLWLLLAVFCIAVLAILVAVNSQAQTTVALTPAPRLQFFSTSGSVLSLGCVYTYAAGTNTPLATYTDGTGNTTNSNPVLLDAAGMPTASGSASGIWLGPQKYKIAVFSSGGTNCSLGSQQYVIDNVSGSNLLLSGQVSLSATTAPSCSGGNYILWADSSALTIKMCNNGTVDTVVGTNATQTLNNKTLNSTDTFNGVTGTAKTLNNIRFADQFTGSDCGAKINAADSDLGVTAGEIWVNQNCGLTWSTAVSISANHVLRFVQGGTYSISAAITVGTSASIEGPNRQLRPNVTPIVTLKMANGANLNPFITLGAYASLSGIQVDGNNANNLSAGPNILINAGQGVQLTHLITANANTHGISITSSGTSNTTGSGNMFKVMAAQNTGDGVFSSGAADWFVTDSEFENNGKSGIELSDSPTWRIVHNDFGQNGLGAGAPALYAYGTAAGLSSVVPCKHIIIGNQFGNNYQDDLQIKGYDTSGGAVTCIGNIISGNSFIGGGFRTPANTYNKITLIDGGQNSITGNLFESSVPAHSEKYAISQTETFSGRATGNQLSANDFNTTTQSWGTAAFLDNTTSGTIGQQIQIRGGVNSSLDLYDITTGASNPHKYFRVNGGVLQVLNSSFANILFSIPDSGAASFPGGLDISTGTSSLKMKDEGQCTMSSGACVPQSLGHTYSTGPFCGGTWTGTGTLTGILKTPSTASTVTPTSSVGTDSAQITWWCFGF